MEVELQEIRDFLLGVPPFDALPGEVLDRIPGALSVLHLRRGRPFPPEDASGPCLYVVRQGAIELRGGEGELVAKYGEGDLHDASCRAAKGAVAPRGFAVEDSLLYCLPCQAFEALRAAHPAFDAHFAQALGERLRRTVLGVVTASDVVRWQSANTAPLVSAVRRAGSVAALQRAAARLPELQVQMVAAGATPRHLGLAVGAVADAITARLLQLAEAELGPAPVPYAWLALGSQARHEQTVLGDQDNALLLDDAFEPAVHDAYFEALARFVNEGLAACGFPSCPGDVMARNPRWRRSLQGWRLQFDAWIERPEPKALMQAALFFDLRAAAGDARLAGALLAHVRQKIRGNEVFVALMAANAIRNRPPIGFFRNLVVASGGEHADTLDLKVGGTMPIVELARIYAFVSGAAATGTVERLRAGAEAGVVSRQGAEDLEHALAFVATLRARHQAEQIKRGAPPDNRLPPAELSRLERDQLKGAFAVVRHHQELVAQVYRARWIV